MNVEWPQWTTELTADQVTGEDQLGVESAAQGYQQFLVPGIITTTDHARYYSFYSWVLYRFINDPDSSRLLKDFRGPYFKRHEAALIAASYGHHPELGAYPGLVGRGSAEKIWNSGDPLSLDVTYFKHTLGGFGQYYRSAMQAMGLVAESEHPRWVYRLTHRGEALAQAFEASIADTAYFQALQDGELATLSREEAIEYGQHSCICPEALASGQDLEPLRDAFFRLDQTGIENPHVRRRLTLGVVLDLVHNTTGEPVQDLIRPALYLGEYRDGLAYTPDTRLLPWVTRWRMVQIRQFYTFGLQCLWASFLLRLRADNEGLTFEDYLGWVAGQLPDGLAAKPSATYLDSLGRAAGLSSGWRDASTHFDEACRQAMECDEYTLYKQARDNRRDAQVLLTCGLQMLAQLFLRFLLRHLNEDSLWQELATKQRLPMACYFNGMLERLNDPGWTVSDWLEWLYRDFIIGQHEFIALEKLRYQRYDTFKFHYRDGYFYWPFSLSRDYREPIRLAALRLFNALTILIDLGLVESDGTRLTEDGLAYRMRVLEMDNGA
ncbi:MAG: hypothetical protein H8D43_03485 [Chloroflexi bacterium]|nr:hypothetical protein [Chloroflexota bacterium]